MKYETRKQLKNKLEALKRENMFLHRRIDSREQAHDIACEQRDRAMAETQEDKQKHASSLKAWASVSSC